MVAGEALPTDCLPAVAVTPAEVLTLAEAIPVEVTLVTLVAVTLVTLVAVVLILVGVLVRHSHLGLAGVEMDGPREEADGRKAGTGRPFPAWEAVDGTMESHL